MKAGSLAVATFGLALSSGIASCEEPFDLRGIRLGITLADFRKVPFPDREKQPGARVICTPDKEQRKALTLSGSELDLSGNLKAIGVIVCHFYGKSGSYPTSMWGMDFAGVCSCIQTFFFSPAEISSNRQSRLFQISTRLPNRHFENVVAAFTAKHGKSSDT